MTPAKNGDDSPADGVQGDDAGQQECEHDQGCAALAVAVSACHRNSDDADQKGSGEKHATELGKSKPVTEPAPIASQSPHAFSLGARYAGVR